MAKKKTDTHIPHHEIEALARCLLPHVQMFFESGEGKREFEEWKTQREKQLIAKTIKYDKGGGIVSDTAAFVSVKDTLENRSHPLLEPGFGLS